MKRKLLNSGVHYNFWVNFWQMLWKVIFLYNYSNVELGNVCQLVPLLKSFYCTKIHGIADGALAKINSNSGTFLSKLTYHLCRYPHIFDLQHPLTKHIFTTVVGKFIESKEKIFKNPNKTGTVIFQNPISQEIIGCCKNVFLKKRKKSKMDLWQTSPSLHWFCMPVMSSSHLFSIYYDLIYSDCILYMH